jgi:hypothetical protein
MRIQIYLGQSGPAIVVASLGCHFARHIPRQIGKATTMMMMSMKWTDEDMATTTLERRNWIPKSFKVWRFRGDGYTMFPLWRDTSHEWIKNPCASGVHSTTRWFG